MSSSSPRSAPRALANVHFLAGAFLLLLLLVAYPRPADAVSIEVYSDATCATKLGYTIVAQPGYCFAWSSYGVTTECATGGNISLSLYYSTGGPSADVAPPSCAGATSKLLTVAVSTSACTPLGGSFTNSFVKVVDDTCTLGPGPVYQVSLSTSESCNSTTTTWNTLVVNGGTSCAPWGGFDTYSWRGIPISNPDKSFSLDFYVATICSTPYQSWATAKADGACYPTTSGTPTYPGLRAVSPVPYTPPPPPPPSGPGDYLIFASYGGSSFCNGPSYAMSFQYPQCYYSGSSAFSSKLRCGGNSSTAFLDTYSGTNCEGTPISTFNMDISSGCSSGSGTSTSSYCAGPSIGYPVFQSPTTGYITRSYTNPTCLDRGSVSAVTRYPLGICVDVSLTASARFSCLGDGSVVQTSYTGRGCSGTSQAATDAPGCTNGASSATEAICIPDAPVPSPPSDYARISNGTKVQAFTGMAAGSSRTTNAQFFYRGSNGNNPLYLTTVVYNPTASNITLRAAGGPACTRFDDSFYTPRTVISGANTTVTQFVNMPCVTPPALIVAGSPNYCCVIVECNEPQGCPYVELNLVQYSYSPVEAEASGSGGAAAGGIIGTGIFIFLVLLALHCLGCIHVPCFDRCFGGGKRVGKAFATSSSPAAFSSAGPSPGMNVATVVTTTQPPPMNAYGPGPAPTSFYPTMSGGGSTVAPPAGYSMPPPAANPYGQGPTVAPPSSATAPWPGAGGQRTYV